METFFGSWQAWKRREKIYRVGLNILTYIGIAAPLLVYGAVSLQSFFPGAAIVRWSEFIAGLLLLLQLLISTWSLVANWNTNLAFYERAFQENHYFYEEWKELLETCKDPSKTKFIDKRIKELVLERKKRGSEEEARATEDDRSYGNRYVHFQYKRPCQTCKKVPSSMKPCGCKNCGNFRYWRFI